MPNYFRQTQFSFFELHDELKILQMVEMDKKNVIGDLGEFKKLINTI